MGTDGWKGKSVVCVPDSSIPEDISKAAVVLHIGAISFRGEAEEEEAAQQLQLKRDHGYGCSYLGFSSGYNPPYFRQRLREQRTVEVSSVYSVSVTLESSLVDGPSASETTKEIRKPMMRDNEPEKPVQWNYCGIRFDIDLSKIHESFVKIEVNRFYLTEFRINWSLNQQRRGKKRRDQKAWNYAFDAYKDHWSQYDDDEDDDDEDTPPNIVEPSQGITVIGRARIPLWDFLRGEKNRKIGSVSPLSDLLSGDENRVASFALAKVEKDGSGTREEGALQVLFNINKYMPTVEKQQQQAEKKLDSFKYYLE